MWLFKDPRIQASLLKHSILWPKKYNAIWVPSPLEVVRPMLELAEVQPEDKVYDLGCGDGRVIITAVSDFGARAVGIEIDPLRYVWCQVLITLLGLRSRVRIIFGDFFDQDLGQADVISCYLPQDTNEKLQEKFKQELKLGARIVSHNFQFPGLPLHKTDQAHNLYLYRLAEQIDRPCG